MFDSTMSAALQKLQEMYNAKNFQEGIDLLLQTKSDWEPGQFHELLGSFYMKLENFAVARYHFEMAMSKGAVTPTVTHNLEYVLSKMGLASGSYSSWWERLLNTISLMPFEFWAALSLLCLALAFWKFRTRWQMGKRIAIIALWLMALVPQAIYWGVYESRVSAIVLKEAPLYEGPSAVFEAPKTLRAGEKVIISKSADGWSFIISPQVLSGWIKNDSLGFLGRK